jgi:hypothetical protein
MSMLTLLGLSLASPQSPPWSAVYGVHINARVDHHGHTTT